MKDKKYIKPDVTFEVSWEVCNKVGGIYTVLSSKYLSIKDQLGGQYIFIGPDVWMETSENPDFVEDKSLFHAWKENAKNEGLKVRTGNWNIPGTPVAILVDFTPLFSQKDEIFASLWETYKLDSLTGGWDYIEPALFGYAAGQAIESFYNFYLSPRDKILAHFHEWMTGVGILHLKKEVPQVGTMFTTHATTLGRSMTGNNLPLYSSLNKINTGETAKKLGITSKFSLEANAALEADSVTTVSEITATECKHFFGKEVDVITPNGFSDAFVPEPDKILKEKTEARKKIIHVAEALLNQKLQDDACLVLTSGRYEFFNKGIDAFIDALAEVNETGNQKRQLVAFIAVPGNHSGPNTNLLKRIKKPDFKKPLTNEYLTHILFDMHHDPVIRRILDKNLNNGVNSNVKVIFVPVYLNGSDGVFNMHYYHFLNAFDLTVFPSFYEPWGYTPLESIAFGIPTITTTLAGFGSWVVSSHQTPHRSVSVIERNEINYNEFVLGVADVMNYFLNADDDSYRQTSVEAFKLAKEFLWDSLIENYLKATSIACNKADKRLGMVSRKASVEYTITGNGVQDKPQWKKIFIQSQVPPELEPLKELSMNLWWSWNYEAVELFQSIDEKLWEKTEHNPVALINRLSYDKLQKLKTDTSFLEKLQSVYDNFEKYMDEAQNKPAGMVGYFSMEYGLHESVKMYSGGLGILAGDYLKEASDSNKNLVAVGLMYRYGYFRQSISIFGDQIAENVPQKYADLPLHPVRESGGQWLVISLALPGRTLFAKVWKLKVGRIDLYLLDTDIDKNTLKDREITHHLYGGDWNNRFKQELLLGVGGVRLMYALNLRPDIYHLNEGHAAFAGIERLRHLVEKYGMSFETAQEVIRGTSLFTTHTPVPAGHDTFSEDILRTYIPHYAGRLNISWEKFMDLGRFNKGNPQEKFSMSVLAANLSQEMNGVSKIHGRVTREMFRDLYPGYFKDELHIGHVTNGVHYPTWTNRIMQTFYAGKLGKSIIEDQTRPEFWKNIHNVPDIAIWKKRKESRQEFIRFIRDKYNQDMVQRQETPGTIYESLEHLTEDALYIGFARRFATYKRAHLLFTNLEKLETLLNIPDRPVRFVFAGKAHPNDKPGQDLIKRILELSRRPGLVGKIIFLENYDMAVGRKLVSGVDVWLNTPTRPLEASGTSGEKAVMNGVLNFSVLDGWWAEGYTPNAGWAIQEAKTYANQAFQDEFDAEIIYQVLEDEIIPLYFNRNKQGVPEGWMAAVKNNLAQIAPRFTMKRMLDDYYEKFYSKLFERSQLVRANNYEFAYKIEEWKQSVLKKWDHIEVKSVRLPDSSVDPLSLGEAFKVEVVINPNGIPASDIGVDIVFGQKEVDAIQNIREIKDLALVRHTEKEAVYSCTINLTDAGVFEFAFRIYPTHKMLPHKQDFCLVKWA